MDGGAEDDLKEDYHVQDDQDGGAKDNYVRGDFARTWGPGVLNIG